ncbi:glycoside hydrolase family 13 protein [Hymenobacter cheonanensis]|uniref:glycoside hydrolase family 13 protein n=1 Tax=Hymenobacter sp. CA2-7 TaxID=3063993 RepID=UPI002712954B|nr:alpha-glucosidase [Hymenobacter sp. CA2-7]MDO7887190.1 alpha-glucosidase [Hymenobacter sp. CA2-7]
MSALRLPFSSPPVFRLAAALLLAGGAVACNQTTKTETGTTTATQPDKATTTPAPKALAKPAGWWKETVVYQLYPRSFQDSNGDGVGDLKGIISRLDYLKSLGVGTVWLNPIYASPNDDNGYDISDYRQIMPELGTMADFDELLKGMHARGIKLVMDLVVNHSSDEHAWFKSARASRTSPYRDYYYWWPAEKGTPPARFSTFDVKNNAWQYDAPTKSYYLHYFSKKQPDLNWNNPKLRQEVHNIMRYWLDKGIDGFRMDAFQFVAKDPTFPPMPGLTQANYTNAYNHGPHLHDYLREINEQVLSHYNVMSVAEGAGRNPTEAMLFVDPARKELDMTYHFEGVGVGSNSDTYKLTDLKRVFTKWDSAFAQKGWQAIDLGNHDQPRMVSKFGDDRLAFRAPSAKLLNTFLLTMRGTPYCYNGDELGMTNSPFTGIADYRDVAARNAYTALRQQGGDEKAFFHSLARFSRDHSRTPFQWNASANAGFTTGTPWIKVNPNYVTLNEASEDKDSASVLNYFRRAIAVRKQHKVLVHGQYQLLDAANPNIYAYTRTLEAEKVLVVLNFSSAPRTWPLPAGLTPSGAPWLNNYSGAAPAGPALALQPWQAVVYQLR